MFAPAAASQGCGEHPHPWRPHPAGADGVAGASPEGRPSGRARSTLAHDLPVVDFDFDFD